MGDVTNGEIYELLKNVLKKTDTIEKELVTNKRELTEEIRKIKTELKQELEELRQENNDIKQESHKLKIRLTTAERKAKKYNLVFYGVEDNRNKVEDLNRILRTINEKLELHCEHVNIRDSYRIGQLKEGKVRPIVVEFANYQLKAEILANSKKFKGSGVFVQNDYTAEDYQERKILLENLRTARENDLKSVIKNNTLIVEGEQYTIEDLKNHLEPFGKKHENIKQIQTGKSTALEDTNKKAYTEKNDIIQIIDDSSKKQDINTEHGNDKINFRELISAAQKTKKQKEKPTELSNQIKRSTRLNKISEEK